MKIFEKIRNLPTPLLYVMGAFILFPYSSIHWIETPSEAFLTGGILRCLLVVFSYWIVPGLITLFAYLQNFYLIPAFFIECSFLLIHSVINRHLLQMPVIEFLLAVALTLFSFVFLRRDSLYPLLASDGRVWRKNPRLSLQVPIRVWLPHFSDKMFSVVLDNWSLTGIGFTAPTETIQTFVKQIQTDRIFSLKIDLAGDAWVVKATLVHSHDREGRTYVGLSVHNPPAMRQLLNVLSNHYHTNWFMRYWTSEGFHHAALLSCAITFAVILLNPSCSQTPNPNRERATTKVAAPPINSTVLGD